MLIKRASDRWDGHYGVMTAYAIRISLGFGLFLAVAVSGCDAFRLIQGPGPSPDPSPGGQAPSSHLELSPAHLDLNVPSDESCPCPFESTGSFVVSGLAATSTPQWTVLEPGVATISPNGFVSALSVGTTEVRLMENGRVATATIQVRDQGGRAAVIVQ